MVTKASPVVAEKAIEEIMNEALAAAEPGDPRGSAVDGFKEAGAVSVFDPVSAGYVKVWNIETGDMSIVNKNMLKSQLDKKNDRYSAHPGERAFTTDPSKVKGRPVDGTLMCPLHVNHPNRPVHMALGFSTCKKANLRTPLDVRTHMQARHKREWQSLEEDRTRRIQEEERAVRQALIRNQAQPQAQPVKTVPVEAQRPRKGKLPPVSELCPDCKAEIKAKNIHGLHWARGHHRKKQHGATSLSAGEPR